METFSLAFLCFSACFCAAIAKEVEIYEDAFHYKEEYELPKLPYSYDALEPFIDERTMRLHHLDHHANNTKNLNFVLHHWRASVRRALFGSVK